MYISGQTQDHWKFVFWLGLGIELLKTEVLELVVHFMTTEVNGRAMFSLDYFLYGAIR